MKNITLILIICLTFLSSIIKAQYENNSTNLIPKGTIIVEPYFGLSLLPIFWRLSPEVYSEGKGNSRIFGPLGVKFEYLVSKRIGLGLDANYKYNIFYLYADKYTNSYYLSQARIMARMNIHFVKREHFDYYGGVGLGYKYNYTAFSSTNNSHNYERTIPENITPIAFRALLGFRYLFENNITANLEVGISGGSFVTCGLTYIFLKK